MGQILKPSQEALDNAVLREMRTGEMYRRKLNERKREQAAARDAQEMKGHRTVQGLGKCVLSIPQQEYFTIAEKMGTAQCWKDKGFIRDVQRLHPHLAPNKA